MREFIIRYKYTSPESRVVSVRVKADSKWKAWDIFSKSQRNVLGRFIKVGKIMPVKYK